MTSRDQLKYLEDLGITFKPRPPLAVVAVLCHPAAKMPSKSDGNVGIDLAVVSDKEFFIDPSDMGINHPPYFTLPPNSRYLFSTGIKLNIPDGFAIIFKDRSGNAAKKGLHVFGGVFDSSYSGELKVVLFNSSNETVRITEGDRICQMVVIQDWNVEFCQGQEHHLKDSERGEKGFGSSG